MMKNGFFLKKFKNKDKMIQKNKILSYSLLIIICGSLLPFWFNEIMDDGRFIVFAIVWFIVLLIGFIVGIFGFFKSFE